MMRDFEPIRRALVDQIGTPEAGSQKVWDYFVREGHVEAVQNGSRDLLWLSERVQSFLEASGRWAKVFKPREEMLSPSTRVGDHMMVLSRLLAKEAAEREDVRSFRQQVLGGQLLKPVQVERWILGRQPKEGGSEGMVLRIEAPAGIEFARAFRLKSPITVRETIGGEWRTLDYATPGVAHVKAVATPATKGDLARLRFLSEDLAKQYHWQQAQATVFVLTGQIPVVPSFRPSVENRWPGPRRITLDIDLILSPKDLAARYARVRQQLRPEKARRRELSQKHLTLALFITARPGDEPWAKRFKAWNMKYPRWKYSAESNFRRDASRAVERVRAPIVAGGDVMRAFFGGERASNKAGT